LAIATISYQDIKSSTKAAKINKKIGEMEFQDSFIKFFPTAPHEAISCTALV
jgi:hypothetical protein